MEYKAGALYVDAIEGRTVKQIFAVMGNVDDGYDRLWPGAFKKTIKERLDRVRVLWQHDAGDPPIGVPVALKELSEKQLPDALKERYPEATGGLYGEVAYLETPRAEEVLQGIKAGAITENSIGYDPLKFDFEPTRDGKSQIRNLREVRLWDISSVNWGLNSATMNMKTTAAPIAVRALAELEAWLERAAAEGFDAKRLARMDEAVKSLRELLAAEPPSGPPDPALTVAALMQRIKVYEMSA